MLNRRRNAKSRHARTKVLPGPFTIRKSAFQNDQLSSSKSHREAARVTNEMLIIGRLFACCLTHWNIIPGNREALNIFRDVIYTVSVSEHLAKELEWVNRELGQN